MINQLGQNTLTQLLGKIISTLIGLVVVALMTRGLGRDNFGAYTTVVTFLQFFGILTDFGLNMTVARELGSQRLAPDRLLGNLLSFRTITSGIAYVLAPTVAWLIYPSDIAWGISLTSLAFFLSSLSQSFNAVFQSELKSGKLVWGDLSGRLVLLLGTINAVIYTWPLTGYLTLLVLANATSAAVVLRQTQKLLPYHWQLDRVVWQELWSVTWPVALTIALNLIYFKTDTIILSLFRSRGEVGLYGAAYKVLEVLLAVPAIIGGLVLPLAARYRSRQQTDKIKNLFHGSFDALLAGGLAIIVVCWLIGVPMMTTLAGADFAQSGLVLGILSLATAFIFLGNAAGYFIFALDKQKTTIPLYTIAAVAAVTCYLWLIPRFGMWAAAWTTVGVEGFMTLGSLLILKHYGLTPSASRLPKILLATFILGLGIKLIPWWWLGLIISGLFYLLALWLLKLLPQEELSLND